MKICLVGYGYYSVGSVGSVGSRGGTVVAGILRFLSLSPSASLDLSIVCYDERARARLEVIADDIRNRVKAIDRPTQLVVAIEREQDIANQHFDGAIISSPEHTHLHYLKLFSANTRKILCVKPIGTSSAEVQQALGLQKATGTEIYVEFHKRFDLANKQFVRSARQAASAESRFHFQYGQKSEVPLEIFTKWSHKSNPFQYLAPHYLDLTFQALGLTNQEANLMEVEGAVTSFTFSHRPDVTSLVSASLELTFPERRVILDATCNWMEPAATPYSSRQVFEFQSANAHLISEQDRRGQRFATSEGYYEPNPYFHVDDPEYFADGYGPESVRFFLEYVAGGSRRELAPLIDYVPVAKVLDYVNGRLG